MSWIFFFNLSIFLEDIKTRIFFFLEFTNIFKYTFQTIFFYLIIFFFEKMFKEKEARSHWKSLQLKKSRPLKEINFGRIQIQKGALLNIVCYHSSWISFDTKEHPFQCNLLSKRLRFLVNSESCDTKERPFQHNVLSKQLDKLRYKRATLLT